MWIAGDARDKTDALAGRAGLRDGRPCGTVPAVGGELSGACHLVDLPEGYHAPTGGQAWHDQSGLGNRLPSGRRVIGLRQVDEMALRARSSWSEPVLGSGGALATLASAARPDVRCCQA